MDETKWLVDSSVPQEGYQGSRSSELHSSEGEPYKPPLSVRAQPDKGAAAVSDLLLTMAYIDPGGRARLPLGVGCARTGGLL